MHAPRLQESVSKKKKNKTGQAYSPSTLAGTSSSQLKFQSTLQGGSCLRSGFKTPTLSGHLLSTCPGKILSKLFPVPDTCQGAFLVLNSPAGGASMAWFKFPDQNAVLL